MSLHERKLREFILVLLIFGVFGVFVNQYYKQERYYLGESLKTIQFIAENKPEYHKIDRRTSIYLLKSKSYKSTFSISRGTFNIIYKDEKAIEKLENIKSGDTIKLKIKTIDEILLADEEARPRIIEISTNQSIIVSADQVLKHDKKWYHINLSIAYSCIVLWVFLMWKRRRKRFFMDVE